MGWWLELFTLSEGTVNLTVFQKSTGHHPISSTARFKAKATLVEVNFFQFKLLYISHVRYLIKFAGNCKRSPPTYLNLYETLSQQTAHPGVDLHLKQITTFC